MSGVSSDFFWKRDLLIAVCLHTCLILLDHITSAQLTHTVGWQMVSWWWARSKWTKWKWNHSIIETRLAVTYFTRASVLSTKSGLFSKMARVTVLPPATSCFFYVLLLSLSVSSSTPNWFFLLFFMSFSTHDRCSPVQLEVRWLSAAGDADDELDYAAGSNWGRKKCGTNHHPCASISKLSYMSIAYLCCKSDITTAK